MEQDAVRVERDEHEKIWYIKTIHHRIDGFFKATEDLIFSNKQSLKNIEEFGRRVTFKSVVNKGDATQEKEQTQDVMSPGWFRTILDIFIKSFSYLGAENKKKETSAEKPDATKVDPGVDELTYLTDGDIEFKANEIVFESDVEFSSTPEFREMTPQEKEIWDGDIAREEQKGVSQWTDGKDKGIPSVGSELPFEQVIPTPQSPQVPETPRSPEDAPLSGPSSSEPFERPTQSQPEGAGAPPEAPSAAQSTPKPPEAPSAAQSTPKRTTQETPDATPAPPQSVDHVEDGAAEPRSVATPDSRSEQNPPKLGTSDGGLSENRPSTPAPVETEQAVDVKPTIVEPSKDAAPVHDAAPRSQSIEQPSAPKSQKVDEAPVSRFQFMQPEAKEKLEDTKRLPDAAPVPHNRLQFRSIEPLPESPTIKLNQLQGEQQQSSERQTPNTKKKSVKRHDDYPPMITGDIGKKKWLEAPSMVSQANNRRGDFGITGDLV